MKLTGDLKKRVEQAASMKEARSLLEQVGIVLTDEEMETVAAGIKDWHRIKEWNPHINKS